MLTYSANNISKTGENISYSSLPKKTQIHEYAWNCRMLPQVALLMYGTDLATWRSIKLTRTILFFDSEYILLSSHFFHTIMHTYDVADHGLRSIHVDVCIYLRKHKYLTLLISCTFDSESRQLISHFCDLRFMHVYEIAERGLGSIHVDYICWSTGVWREPTCLL